MQTIGEMLDCVARYEPESIAIIFDGLEMTYRELNSDHAGKGCSNMCDSQISFQFVQSWIKPVILVSDTLVFAGRMGLQPRPIQVSGPVVPDKMAYRKEN